MAHFAPSPPVPNNKPRTLFCILERAFTPSILMFCVHPHAHSAKPFDLAAESLLWCFSPSLSVTFPLWLYASLCQKKKKGGICMQDTSTQCPQCVFVCVVLLCMCVTWEDWLLALPTQTPHCCSSIAQRKMRGRRILTYMWMHKYTQVVVITFREYFM